MSNRMEKGKEPFVGSVHDYIVNKYKDKWTKKEMNLFEREYNNNLTYLSSDPSDKRDEIIKYQQDLLDLYCKIHHTPKLKRDLAVDPEVQEEAMKQAMQINDSVHSDTAALNALNYLSIYTGLPSDEGIETIDEATRASAEKKNRDEQNQIVAALEKMAAVTGLEYLVRGAPLQCSYGTHIRHLDMFESHGLYLKDKPLLHKKDCEVNKNIFPFGICNSPYCESGEKVTLHKGARTDQYGNYLEENNEDVITGFRCIPRIPDREWKNFKKDTLIAQNAVAGIESKDECDCYEAITSASFLICEKKGIIFPLSSGQQENSTYQPAFINYPFDDFGSPAFYEWCDMENICPYYPGKTDFVGWYQEKIHTAMDKKKKKEAKALYGQCLDEAYQMGLDNMSKEEQDKIHSMVTEYGDSGLLKGRKLEEMKEKYSGLRMNYGSNRTDMKSQQRGAARIRNLTADMKISDPSNATKRPDQ